MKLLVADDEIELANALVAILKHSNYTVDAVYNGNDALDYALAGDYDGIILDIMMPGLDGMEVLKSLRDKGISTPVLFLTAKTEVDDRIKGLDLGADDYIPKPFDMGEMLARVRAMLRRKADFAPSNLSCGNLTLDRASYEMSTPDHEKIRLSGREFQMMEMLMINPGILISTEKFMDKIWGLDSEADISTAWTYISYLRKKLSALKANVQIKAVRNSGYTLEEIK